MTHLVGLDLGSTCVKATVFDLRGRVLACEAVATPVGHPSPGWVERDPEQTWRLAAGVLRHTAGRHGASIAAIGVTGCGNGAVFLDRRGAPVIPGVLSTDTRANRYLTTSDNSRSHRSYAGQLPILLRWLRGTDRAVARKVAHGLFWKDYVRYRLTGVMGTDYTDAGAAGLLDLPDRKLRQPESVLPPMAESLARAGEVSRAAATATGIGIGTPVFVGCIDCEAAAIGSGIRLPGEVSIVAGTWSINQCYATQPPRRSRHFLVNVSTNPDRWMVLEASACSAGNFDWALRAFGADLAQASAEARRQARTSLLFVPRVPTLEGAFVGLGSSHGRGDLFRAVMEGVVFAHRSHLAVLARSLGPSKRLVLTGGAAANHFWCQLFADGFGQAVQVPRCAQVGTLGAAICAGVGVGLFPSMAAAQKAMASGYHTFYPDDEQHLAMTRNYRRYLRVLRQLAA